MVRQAPATRTKSKVVRVKYPSFRDSLTLSASQFKHQTTHHGILQEMTQTLCDNERTVLDEWVKEDTDIERELERKGILGSLHNILDQLPVEIAKRTPNDVRFYAELSLEERQRILILHKQIQQLEALHQAADTFEANVRSMTVDPPQTSAEVSKDVEEAFSNYQDILQRMDGCCNAVLQLSDDMSAQLFNARQIQGELYDKCNERRSKALESKGAKNDPKEILKTLPKFYK
jgi:hypothetical protein